jgi:hypothetical protein
MNERIRALAEKANIEFTYDPTETPVRAFVECWEDDLEKFAELIVGECAGIYDKIDNGNLHMGTDNYLEALHKTFRS